MSLLVNLAAGHAHVYIPSASPLLSQAPLCRTQANERLGRIGDLLISRMLNLLQSTFLLCTSNPARLLRCCAAPVRARARGSCHGGTPSTQRFRRPRLSRVSLVARSLDGTRQHRHSRLPVALLTTALPCTRTVVSVISVFCTILCSCAGLFTHA